MNKKNKNVKNNKSTTKSNNNSNQEKSTVLLKDPTPNYLTLTIKQDYKTLSFDNILSKIMTLSSKIVTSAMVLSLIKLFL